MLPGKVYYFICAQCGRRMEKELEAPSKPGVCSECYSLKDLSPSAITIYELMLKGYCVRMPNDGVGAVALGPQGRVGELIHVTNGSAPTPVFETALKELIEIGLVKSLTAEQAKECGVDTDTAEWWVRMQ